MRRDSSTGDPPAERRLLSFARPAAGRAAMAVALPGGELSGRHVGLLGPRIELTRPVYGRAALGLLLAMCVAVVVFASSAPNVLVAHSQFAFPGWMAGPIHDLSGRLIKHPQDLGYGLSVVLVAMTVAYGVALASVRMLSMRTIVIVVVALHAVLLLSPPLQLSDLFNYLGYARLGGLHHFNPYTHVIVQERHDPIYALASWHNLTSPYGQGFTLATYPLAWLPLPVAYWVLKTATVLASLGFIALVARCARQLGRDPRFPVLFVAANPLFLIYEVGGFHNDVFMLVATMAAISLLLDRRDVPAGVALMLAVSVKFTAVLLLPFLLLAAPSLRRRARVLAGVVLAAVPLVAGSLAAFGSSLPNLSDQSSLLTLFSVPNLVGLVLGVGGGTPTLLSVASILVVVAVAVSILRHRDWLTGAGWSTLALMCGLAWLVPWYIVWVLPFAALGTSTRLRRASLAFTVFLVVTFMPVTMITLTTLGVQPKASAVYRASMVRELRLEQ